eukprot:TRINITY_DN10808_c0_g1_i1.p1 TRINITY_DN10808_c0_g1~~TRINITY_DN10808_c0_g1_i1.p1  ORF type:complete len:477 (+),score=79.57 TRINITY_DN10808_c0_g1_i1:1-1431(+)
MKRERVQAVFIIDASSRLKCLDDLDKYLKPIFENLKESHNNALNNQVYHILEYAMVLYKDYRPNSDYVVKATQFTSDFNHFNDKLEKINFRGGGFESNAIVEGLCAANQLFNQSYTEPEEEIFRKVFLFNNSTPNMIDCSCYEKGDCLVHIDRLLEGGVEISVVSWKRSSNLNAIFTRIEPSCDVSSSPVTIFKGINMDDVIAYKLPKSTPINNSTTTPGPKVQHQGTNRSPMHQSPPDSSRIHQSPPQYGYPPQSIRHGNMVYQPVRGSYPNQSAPSPIQRTMQPGQHPNNSSAHSPPMNQGQTGMPYSGGTPFPKSMNMTQNNQNRMANQARNESMNNITNQGHPYQGQNVMRYPPSYRVQTQIQQTQCKLNWNNKMMDIVIMCAASINELVPQNRTLQFEGSTQNSENWQKKFPVAIQCVTTSQEDFRTLLQTLGQSNSLGIISGLNRGDFIVVTYKQQQQQLQRFICSRNTQ